MNPDNARIPRITAAAGTELADACIATSPLPLDLHVLGLPLAFILSQDQTLHCILYISKLNPSTLDSIKRINALSYCFGTLLVLKSFSIFKQLDLFHFFPKRAAKIRTFFISPNFFTFFFNFFITFVPETYSEWHLTGKYSSSSPRSEPSQ